MQRFFNISQLWKKGGNNDAPITKEAGEQGGPSFSLTGDPSSSGGLVFSRPPPSNVSTSSVLFTLKQKIEQHFSLSEISSTNEVPDGANQSRHKIERIQHFLSVLRSPSPTSLLSDHTVVCGSAATTVSSSGAPHLEKNGISTESDVTFSVGKGEEGADTNKNAYFTALTSDREYLVQALGDCLIEIPEQRLKSSRAEKKKCDTPVVHSVEKDDEKTPIKEKKSMENEAEKKPSEHSAEENKSAVGDTSGTGTGKEKITVSTDAKGNESCAVSKTQEKNDLEPQKAAAPSVSSMSSTSADSSKNFDLLDWRQLLLEITELLIAIDTCLYFELFQRGKGWIISRFTPLEAIPSLPTPTELPATASALDTSTSLSITLMNSVTSRRKKNTEGSKTGTRETLGSTGVNRFAIESHKMIEDILNRISSIATWVTVRSVIQHQIDALQKSSADACRKSEKEGHSIVDSVSGGSEKGPGGSRASTNIPAPSGFAPLIDWRSVLTDLRKIFQGEFECMMEAILSAAFLRANVKELMSCIIQEPTPQKVLQDALSFKEGKPHKDDLPCGSPLATKIGDAPSITSHLGGSSRSSSVLSGSSCGISSSGTASGGRTYGSVTPPGNAVGLNISASNASSRPLVSSMVGEQNHGRPSSPTQPSASSTNAAGSGSSDASPSTLKAKSPKHKPLPISAPLLATSSTAPSSEITDLLTGISMEDLYEQVEADYQHHVLNSLSEYLESVYFPSSSESHTMQNVKERMSFTEPFSAESKSAAGDGHLLHDAANTAEKKHFLSVRVFCPVAATYFCCSNGWSVESREERFQILEELEARRGAKERRPEWKNQLSSLPPHAETPFSSSQGESQVAPPAHTSAVENVEDPHFPPPLTNEQAEQELLQAIEARIFSMSWACALHRRVEQCIAARPPALFPAKKYCEKELAEAEVLSSFLAKQRALTSLINYFLAAGLSQEARQYSLRHFDKEKKELTQSNPTQFSAVRYLQSMVQLALADAACEDNTGVVETVQTLALQANLCDALLTKSVPPLSQNNIIRFSELRSTVLLSRAIYLREGWRSHIALKSGKDALYFEEYLLALRQLRSGNREVAVFEAQMECGHQFMQKMEYNEAAEHFLAAVKLAKREPAVTSFSSSSRTSSEADFQPHPIPKGSSYRSTSRLSVTGFGNLTFDEEHADHEQKEHKATESMWRLAESERLLALACVSQAEQEVSVPDRRLKLNLAVNYAYAAQAVLQKWQAKGSLPRCMWTAAPSNLIVNGRALLLLNQPKKVVLLLEPLVEDKPTSAAIRPPMWREALLLKSEVLTAEDIVLRMDLNSVIIDVFQLYAQCIVRFDVKKALCVVGQVRQLLFSGAQWIEAVRNLILEADVKEDLPSTVEISQALRMSWTPTDEHFRPVVESGEKEELAGGVRRSEDIAESSASHPSLPSQVPIHQSENTLRVVLKSKNEESRALGALERGSWYICRALRDLEITKGDAVCKLKLWKSAFFTFWRLVYLMKNPIAAEWSCTERFSPSHYRASGGPPTGSPAPNTFSPEKNSEYAALSGLSSEWCVQLLSAEELTSPTSLMEDPLLSGSRAEFSDEVDNMDRDSYLVKVMMEEEEVDHRTAAILILSKLATVLQGMGEIDKSIQYHMKVVEYSMKMKSKLLEYKSSLELARLYTSIHASEESQSMWESVSELAREYGDQEVARETMRNLITAQEASQRFFNVIESAEELHGLARAAEGAEAAADTRFALEALAKAQLELDQYDECLTALDEREKVQENNDEWSGKLFEMRSRALIGQGRFAESVKVLSSYLVKAKQLKKFDEVGNALSCLAKTFVLCDHEIRAQECYIESILAFSQLPVLNVEVKRAVLAAARWLVNDFYLSDVLVDAHRVAGKMGPNSMDTDKLQSNSGQHGRPGISSSSSTLAPMEELKNVSGNLDVIFREEELRRVALLSASHGGEEQECSKPSMKSATAGSGDALLSPIQRRKSWRDVLIDDDGSADGSGMRSDHHEDPKLVIPAVLGGRKSSLSAGGEAMAAPERPACEKVGNLGNALHCRRPAALAPTEEDVKAPPLSLDAAHPLHEPSEGVTPQGDPFSLAFGSQGPKGKEKQTQQLMVSTKSCVRALAVIEWCTQLLVQRTPYTALSPCAYAPAEAVHFALMMHPNSAFIFFFPQYASVTGRYNVIIRPPKSSFFITEQAELLNTIAFPQIFPSSAENLLQEDDNSFRYADLKMLSEDLWDPVRKAFEKAHSRIDQASCVFIVPDTSLYNVPFGALGATYIPPGDPSKGRKSIRKPPLGAQCPLVVTLTLTHLVSSGMIRNRTCTGLLKGKQFFRYAALFDDLESECVQNPKEIISVAKRMVLGRKSILPTGPPAFRPRVPQEGEPFKSLSSWTISPTLSKARLIEILRDRSTKMVLLGSPSCAGNSVIKACDGTVSCEDILCSSSSLIAKKSASYSCQHIELAILQNDIRHMPTADKPGLAAKLILNTHCARVLRVENVFGGGLCLKHRKLIVRYFSNLEKVLKFQLNYPFALALQMTMKEAWEEGLPVEECCVFTLVGAP